MKRLAGFIGLSLLLTALFASQAAALGGPLLSQAHGAHFPQKAFLLSLPSRGVVTPSQIKVTEGGRPVRDLSVQPAAAIGQSHFGTVLVIDTSDSMQGAAEQSAIHAARAFIAARNPQQPVGIVFFDQTPRVVVPMTTDKGRLDAALATVPALHSGTHMYDAVAAAVHMLTAAKLTGGSVVLVSDGHDTGSKTSEQAAANLANNAGARVYTVGVLDSSFDGTGLRSLADASRGVYIPVNSSAMVPLYHHLGVALSNQYLIRYTSRVPLGTKVAVVARVAGHGVAYATYAAPGVPAASPSGPAGIAKGTSFFDSTAGALLVCLLIAVLLGLAIFALATTRSGVRTRVGSFIGLQNQPMIEDKPKSLVQRALGDPRSRHVDKSHWSARLAEDIEIARIQIAPLQLVFLTVLGTILLAYVLLTIDSAPVAILAFALPFVVRQVVKTLANRQRRAFSEQLPDNLSVVASALRAGNTFAGSLGVVASDAPEPSRRELRRALADEQLGVPLVDALNKISDRMQSSDFHHVALVATLQQETGGNTAEVLDVVTETIRERLELRRMIRTLTAQGRLAGTVLAALPVLLLLGLSLINPSYTAPLFHQVFGIISLVIAGTLVIIGSLVIRRIVDIDV